MARRVGGPTAELGLVDNMLSALPTFGQMAAQMSPQEGEYVPEFLWPESNRTVNRMRNDAQIDSLYTACTWPIMRYRWQLNPNGANPVIVQRIAEDLGLPIRGERDTPRSRRKGRFQHREHLRHSLLALLYGHMYFEQYGIMLNQQWRLRKLSPRMPHTLTEILVANDGGLAGIKQLGSRANGVGILSDSMIPVDRLSAFVWQREGANWYGRSILRPIFGDWVAKDRLMRIDVLRHERNGMGVPTIEANPKATKAQMDAFAELAQSYKVGEASGGALPNGARLRLVGVEGSVSDALASIKYHDEAMARSFLAMFVQLGVTKSGSRALGEQFIDFFTESQKFIAEWYMDTMNEHVLEDWVDWNYGEDELCPLIEFDPDTEENLSTEGLMLAIEGGLVRVDNDLEDQFREHHKLPQRKVPRKPKQWERSQMPYPGGQFVDKIPKKGSLADPKIKPVPTVGGGTPGGQRNNQGGGTNTKSSQTKKTKLPSAPAQPTSASASRIIRVKRRVKT
jgi:hypothetical protein